MPISTSTSCSGARQRQRENFRSILSPVPVRATVTQISVRCMVKVECSFGSGLGKPRGNPNTSIPSPTNRMGYDRGNFFSNDGSQATARMATPSTTRIRL